MCNDHCTQLQDFGLIGRNVIAWMSQKQSIHAMLSAEAEYYAAGDAISEMIWLQNLIGEFNKYIVIKVKIPMLLVIDSKACLAMIKQGEPGAGRTKHIELKQHVILGHYNDRKFQVNWIPGVINIADLLTKTITSKGHFDKLVSMIMDGRKDVGECWNLYPGSCN